MPKPSILLLGNQKSGTTAIAALLGKATQKTVEIDPFYKINRQIELRHQLEKKAVDLKHIVERNRKHFSSNIVKDPNFSFMFDELRLAFPDSKYIFIVRDPRENIRSILNRVDIPGNLLDPTPHQIDNLPAGWKAILQGELPSVNGHHYIEKLAARWQKAACSYLMNREHMILIRYEDFLVDKTDSITNLASKVNLDVTYNIENDVDTQYQRKGKPVNYIDFFGEKNLRMIENTCGNLMEEFGYERSL